MAVPEAKPEPCLGIILGILQLFLTTTAQPRRREYTTPYEEEDPDQEPTTEPGSTEIQPTSDSSGESADGPSVDGNSTESDADIPSTSEANPDDSPNEVIPNEEDSIKKLRRANNKRKNWFNWFNFDKIKF